jgi:hypothetical protein
MTWTRGRMKKLRIYCREVERATRRPCFADRDMGQCWVRIVGKLQFAIPTEGTHHHYYGLAWIACVVFRNLPPKRILVVETRRAASEVESCEVRAKVRRRCHRR